jgi:hypothetical protein
MQNEIESSMSDAMSPGLVSDFLNAIKYGINSYGNGFSSAKATAQLNKYFDR